MELTIAVALFALGVLLIIKGGDYFVDAAAWIAEVSGIPKVIVGATVVSLATTLPEIIVSLMAAFQGKADMAIGNAVGSVTANAGLILGVSLLFAPLVIRRKDYALKGLLMLGAVGTLAIFSRTGSLSAVGSVLLFAIFVVFIIENVRSAKLNAAPARAERPGKKEIRTNVLKFLAGTAGIVIGADLLVDNGSIIATRLGVPEGIIAVTMVAIGTSLPELVTAVTALVKKEGSLSAGNIIGANIIDTTLILPLCRLASGGALPFSAQSLALDIPFCLVIASIAILPTLIQSKFARWQGGCMLAVYIAYLVMVIA